MDLVKELQKRNVEVRAKTTLPFKLKDKFRKNYHAIHLKTIFGFMTSPMAKSLGIYSPN